MKGLSFEFPLLGRCILYFQSDSLATFISRQLKNYVIETTDTFCGDCEIEIFNSEVLKLLESSIQRNLYYSRSFKVDNGMILLDNIEYKCIGKSLKIKYKQSNSIDHKVKQIIKSIMCINGIMEYRNNSGVFYTRYLFPLLSIYAACYGYYCIHGSLIRLKNRNIVLTGLDGVGKSTMANMLSSEEGEILSDNIVLFNGTTALNFNLAMRIDLDTKTKYQTIFELNSFKEILPDVTTFGEVVVDDFYNLIRDRNNRIPYLEEASYSPINWVLYLNTAPEIGQANRLMAPWSYVWSSGVRDDKAPQLQIYNLFIPENGIQEAKEIIINER